MPTNIMFGGQTGSTMKETGADHLADHSLNHQLGLHINFSSR